jgi:hypothetical protein
MKNVLQFDDDDIKQVSQQSDEEQPTDNQQNIPDEE